MNVQGVSFRRHMFANRVEVEDLCTMFGVRASTVRRWMQYGPPKYVHERLSMICGNHPSWRGYSVLDGQIRCPNGDLVLKEQIQSFYWLNSALSMSTRRCVVFEKRCRDLERILEAANDTLTRNGITNVQSNSRLNRRSRVPFSRSRV